MNHINRTLICCTAFLLTSCASIVSKSSWPFSVQSDPPGAKVVITNKTGTEILNKKTPTALLLRSGAGYFLKEFYTITISMAGYETKTVNVKCKLNGWYFGNILIGGVIGMLIIDPTTGAMYKLENDGISETLIKSSSTVHTLKIISKDQLPEGLQKQIIQLN